MQFLTDDFADGGLQLLAAHGVVQRLVDQRLVAALSGFGFEESDNGCVQHDRHALLAQLVLDGDCKRLAACLGAVDAQSGSARSASVSSGMSSYCSGKLLRITRDFAVIGFPHRKNVARLATLHIPHRHEATR